MSETPRIDYYEICKMKNGELVDAVMEAHGDGDDHDVLHYAKILFGRVAQLEHQLAAARKDSERLDWLDSASDTPMTDAEEWHTEVANNIIAFTNPGGLREAIDAAIAEQDRIDGELHDMALEEATNDGKRLDAAEASPQATG